MLPHYSVFSDTAWTHVPGLRVIRTWLRSRPLIPCEVRAVTRQNSILDRVPMMKGEETHMKDGAGLHWTPQSGEDSTVFQVNRRQKVETPFIVLNLTNVKTKN